MLLARWEARVPYALGIDLGTTFSAAAVDEHGRTEIVSLGNRAAAVPTVVVVRVDGEVLIGEAAERRAVSEPLRTAREFKRRLGDPTPVLLGGTPYGAEALYARMLRGIVAQVIELHGERPATIVVTHPANYGPYKLDLLQQAVRMAEIGPVTFITEPLAAALHYAGRERIDPGQVVAVYDFGGGTFDAALLRRTHDGFEPIGQPEGIERLGGIDFDEAVFAHVVNSLRATFDRLNPQDTDTRAAIARIREEARNAKEALSVDTDVTIPVILPGVQTSVRLTRQEFEAMIEPRIGETIAALERAVRSAGMRMQDVSKVLLVGGSSRIPLVRQRVRQATGVPVVVDAHPKHAIALGAAEAAARVAGLSTSQQTIAVAAVPPRTVTPAPSAAAPASPVLAAAGASAAGPPPGGAQAATAPGGSLPIPIWLILIILAGAFAIGVAAFILINQLGGDDDDGGSGASATQTAAAGSSDSAVTSTAGGSGAATAADAPTTAVCASVASPEAVLITDIQMQDGDYAIFFESCGFSIEHPEGIADPSLEQFPRRHAHFYWNTLPLEDAGVPGDGPWNQYGGPSPYLIAELGPESALSIANKPADATQICSAISNEDHTIVADSGNCFDVPAGDAASGDALCEADPRPEAVLISDIQIEQDDYAVFFESCGVDIDHPEGVDDPDTSALPRVHAHFYWNTTAPGDAGPPGAGPWLIYGGPSPLVIADYTPGGVMSIVNKPADATEMCVVIVNSDHTVRPDTGNCFALP